MGTGALAPKAEPWQPLRLHLLPPASPPPALAALPLQPSVLQGSWPRPSLQHSPRGGAGPREPQRWLQKRQLKGQPHPCQQLQWGWGQRQTLQGQ